jgi:hypothetical protein
VRGHGGGRPTAVLDLGGLRIVSDPTFDAPGPHGYLTKAVGPAVADDQPTSAKDAPISPPPSTTPG